jgi:hypothetical protein
MQGAASVATPKAQPAEASIRLARGGKFQEKLRGSSIHHPVLPSNPPTRVKTDSSSIPLPWMPARRGWIQCRYPHAASPNSARSPSYWTSNPPIPYFPTLDPPVPS